MKKLLLSIATVLFGATLMSAAEVTFDFANETYGLTRETDNNGAYIESGTALTENGGVTITLNKTEGKNGWRLWSDGLRIYKNSGTSMTLSASENITGVEFTMAKTSVIDAFAVNGGETVTVADKVFTVSCNASTVDLDLTCTKNNGAIVSMKVITEDAVRPEPPAPEVVTLSFTRTGITAAGVSVAVNGVEGATATLTSSHSFKALTNTAIICPDANGNTSPTITMSFNVSGLPSDFKFNTAGLHVHALNASNGYQASDDNKNRHFNVKVDVNEADFVNYTDLDPAAGVTGAHKVWEQTSKATLDATNPMTITLTITKGSVNEGCFFGLESIALSYVDNGGETPDPEPEPIERPEILPDTDKGEVMVHVSAIDLIDGTPEGPKTWTSGTTPAFTVTLDDNTNLTQLSDGTLALVCDNGIVTITSADPNYYISGYVYRALSGDSNEIAIAYPVDGELWGPDEYGYCFNEGMEEGSDVYFIATGSQVVISDIDVIFAPATQQPDPEPEKWEALDRTGWSVSGCSQQDANAAAGKDGGFKDIIDSNPNTFWHASWASGHEDNKAPHYLIFDLGEGEHTADGFGYLPRQENGGNGFVNEYALYFTNEIDEDVLDTTCGLNEQQNIKAGSHENMVEFLKGLTPAIEGTFDFEVKNGSIVCPAENGDVFRERTAQFAESANGRYCIFLIKNAAGTQANTVWGNCAEFNLYTITGGTKPNPDPEPEPEPEPDPEPTRPTLANEEGDVLVNVPVLTDGTLSDNGKTWTSNTEPQFTLTLEGDGKMEIVDDDPVFRLACGNVLGQYVTVTVASADPAYFVSGYVFDATGYAGDQAVITFGDKTITTDGTTQYACLDGIEEGTAATFTAGTAVAANAKKPIISNFDVRFSPATVIPDPNPDPDPEIPDPSTWTALDRSNWTVSGCSQRGGAGDTDGGFNEAKDGNGNTYWHSNWQQGAYEHATPHFLVFDLGEGEHAYDGFGYLPRQNTAGGNGYCNDYAVYVTNDISEISTAGSYANSYTTDGHSSMTAYMADHTAAAEGTMTYTTSNTDRPETRVHFTETKSERYVIFVFKTTANVETGKSHANCAEFNLYAFRTEPIPVDHRPAGIAWLDNLAKLTVLYDADAINAAKDAVNALAEDATEEDVMAAAKTIYDNDSAIGKHVRFLNVRTADLESAAFYLGGNDETMHFVYGEGAESDLSTVWAVVGTDTPGAYLLFNYGKQQYAGYNEAANQKQPWDEEGEMFEFVVPTSVDGGCTLEETNQLVFISHNNSNDPTGYIHFGKNGTDESQWMITTWTSDSAGSQWRISLADENTAEVTGAYDTETGVYTIASTDSENPFSHNATRHATHTISLVSNANEDETPADVELTDNGDGTFGLDLKEQPQGQYVITIPMGYFATPNGFSAAHTDVINHDYFSSITEVNAAAGDTEWYNMQGMRVAAPAKGGIYIRTTSAGVEKVRVR